MTEETERIYVIPLKKKYFPASKAAPTAVKRVKQYINHHMKVDEKDIWIDESLNNAIWSKGKYKMPGKIRVKAVRFEDGVVEVYLPELEFEKSRRELLQEERAKKTPILRKEEMEPEEGVDEAGTDDYEVVPTADGDVKLKKKKQEKESAEEEESEEESEEETEAAEEESSRSEEEPEKPEDEKKPAEAEPKESKASSETTSESEEEKKKTDQS
jgi:large subunit ribosomal protein L31e